MTVLSPTLRELEGRSAGPPPPLPIRVGEVARRSPDATAVVYGESHLSYGELLRRVRRLAGRLRGMGVGPEILVAVSLERSPELVVSILGVLEAGAAYLPLDPSYPRERLELMMEDSGVRLLVAAEDGPAAEIAPGRVRRIDPGDRPGSDAPSPAGDDLSRHLAYVIYTSGSTGRPKGVPVGHSGLANLAEAQARVFHLDPGDRVLQFAPASFDASVFEIAMALSTGAALVLAPRNELLPGPGLAALLERARVTCLTLPPSVLGALPEGELPDLSTLVCAGEALPGDLVSRWRRGRRLFNAYGPTETTVWATVDRCRPAEERPPIGRAVPGFRTAVTGPDLTPVPGGDPGELVLGGVAVARGYLGRPGWTAERFVPDALPGEGGEPGGRVYRTGDLARVLPDGRIEFLGRVDQQVKIRGHRVEPGEVEAALADHPEVRSAAVVARPDRRGDPSLVAYAVAPEAETEDLRRFLARRLPEHLRPAGIVLLPELPLLPNGKVDRRALAEEGPEPGDAGGRAERVRAPRSEVEVALAGIWRELLGGRAPGLDDDFFELGGHSLLVGRLVSRVRRGLGVELATRAVFEGRTLEAVARAVEDASEPSLPPIERVPRDEPLPLTFPQERIWFVLELAPGSVAYNSQVTVRFEGPLSAPVLQRALSEVVRRHEAFRSRYFAVDGRPYQEPVPPPPVPLPLIDLRGLPAHRREEAVAGVVVQEGRRPFDVGGEDARPLLVRWRLILEEEGVASLQQVEHHFAHDGWAFAVVLSEIRALYEAFAEGRPPSLPEPVQIGDVAVWQRRLMAGDRLREHLEYWTGRLRGAPPVLELPADRPRPPMPSFRGDVVRVELPLPLARGVRELARSRGVTLFAVLLAGFEALLSRYTAEDDLVVGSGNANRRTEEAEGVVGMLVNTLALRVDLGGEPSFAELLARVTEVLLGSQAYQDMPLDRLIDALGLPRDPSRNPLFQVLFSFHDSPVPDLDFAGLRGRVTERHNRTAKADLNVVAIPRGEQRVGRSARESDEAITLIWEYTTDLFDGSTMVRMVGHYQRFLTAAAAAPERPVAELPLLSAAERAQVLAEWNDTAVPYPRGRSIPELFAETAAQRPEAVAVRQGGRWWTYGELDARSDRLAARLAALGVGPETLVGLAAERSPELVAALLGILKAGGAYLPLDPAYPAERLAFMLDDGRVPVLVAAESALAGLPAPELERLGTRTVSLEEALAAGEPEEPVPTAPTGPRSLAYVLYTSGSTGRPKGVAVEHRSVVRLVKGASYATMDEDEVFLQLAPVPFDASTLELWGALLNGARLEVFPPGVPSLEELGRELEASRVTTLWLTAGLFHRMVEEELPRLAGVGQLLAGGDVLSVPHVDRTLAALGPGQVLINGYGPTEGTTFTCCHRMAAGAQVAGDSVPVGRPISSTRVHLVDPAPARGLAPVPAGVPGELYAGGDGVARGYLARPALTAAAFVPDPFSAALGGAPGARLYRTGDLARWLPGGEVEFLGRMDHQVKLRGFRIEPGEIESVLATHPAVRTAAVIVRGGPPGDRGEGRLVAYLVAAEWEERPDPGALRSFLAERLPDYMVPSAFVPLAELPLDPNGKVDRRALAEEGAEPDAGSGRADAVPPRGPVEEMVAGVWSEVLGRAGVGAHDDFFDLGGHSLAATRVVSRIRRLTGVEIALAALFEHPTVAGLAEAVEARRRGPAAAAPPPPRPLLRDRALPSSFAASLSQERMWFLDRFETERALYDVPAPVRIRGRLDAAGVAAALRALEERHEGLRTVFAEAGSEEEGTRVRQVVLPPEGRPLPLVDLGGLPRERREAELAGLALAEVRRPFDLARAPLWRFRLARLGPEDHALLVTAHHAVTDGWSMGVFFRELWRLYGARVEGREARRAGLPPLPIQYPDFAVWQREWLRGPALEREIDWWRERLAGAPPVLALPTDRPRPPERSGRGGRLRAVLDPSLLTRLRALGDGRQATLFMVLLAAFQAWLGRLSGQDDLAVGAPVANRTRSETEGIVGFFVNSLVLRTDLSGDPSFQELLGRAREVALAAYAHQDVPFEKLVEALEPDRRLEHTPLFQVSLVLQNAASPAEPPPGLEIEPLAVEAPTAKYDLTLAFEERERGLLLRIAYSRDLFDPTTVRRMLRQLETLLEAAVEEPALRVSELPLLAPAEAQALREWNDPPEAVAPVPGATVPDAFRAWARRTPEAVALECGAERWSFQGLTERAEALARRLRSLGVGPEARVALLLEPSAAAIAAVLGVHGAGGAYVPLDPGFPAERLRFLVEDGGVAVVITERARAGSLPLDGPPVLCLEDVDRTCGSPPSTVGEPPAPEDLAYQIYTSGSTGRPKGVAVEHRHLLAYVRAVAARLGVGPGTALATVSPLTADLGNTSVFTALATGGRLVVVPREDASDPEGLAACAERHRFDLLKIVPSHLAALLAGVRWERMLPTSRLVLGGEALPRDLAHRLAGAGAGCRVINHYGPTETTVGVLTHRFDPPARAGGAAAVPLGRPLPGCRVHLADRRLRRVPVGAAGEIVVGGSTVARGYPGRPGRTAEVFVPDPWPAAPGERLYRTGDRARRLAGGEVEFLGRIDGQVKVRGYRVEPGEVEARLLELPEVREAAVVLDPGDPTAGGARLVACYATAPGGEVTEARLRRHLAERLPEPLVPSVFVRLDELPRLPNGKVDRRSLAAESALGGAPAAGAVVPRGPLEDLVARAWGEVLGREGVGPHDDFFALGGHSLLAIRLVSRLRRLTGVDLPVRVLFEHPTVAGQAEEVERALSRAGGLGEVPGEPPIRPVPRDRDLPASFAQERMWFVGRYGGNRFLYNLPTPYRLRGGLDAPALARALGAVVARHEALRTRFRPAREGRAAVAQRIDPRLRVPLPVADLRRLPARARRPEAERLAVAESEVPFDLDRGPLLRAALLRLGAVANGEEEDVLLLDIHHIVSDAWSTGVVLRDLLTSYGAVREGRPARLSELPVQYADFAVWQREWLAGEVLERQLAFWREEIRGAPTLLELPADRPRPAVQTARGDRQPRRLPPELGRGLHALARDRGASPFMLLLAAFQTLLARLSGQPDVPVGVPVANRSRVETEDLVGFFVNALVLRGDLSEDPSFEELLERTRRRTLAAYAHQDLPFEKLVEELRPARDLSHTPLFQVVLNFHDARRATEAPGEAGLEAVPLAPRWRTSKFDLILNAREEGDSQELRLEHNLDLFDRTTARRWLGCFETLLASAVAGPGRRLSELDLLAAAERHQVLREWNDTAADLVAPEEALLHAPFEARAAERPDAVAVVAPGADGRVEHRTYGELDRRASRLARELTARGAGPGTLVGVHLGRSPAMAVAVLGVEKSGAAYVPLEVSWPAERIRWIVSEHRVRHLVTEPSRRGVVEELGGTLEAVVLVDGAGELVDGGAPVEGAGAGPERPPAGPEDPAYVIFTSGSTGRPKGVVVRHRPAANLVSWVNRTFSVGPEDRLLFVTALSFDLSVYDLFGTLAAGGTVRLATAEELEDPVRQVETLVAERITFWDSAPAALQRLAPLFPDPEELLETPALRLVFLSGDWVPLTLPDRVRRSFPGARVVALGGATEATVWSNYFPVVEVSEDWASIPYGRPIANARYHVLDADLRLCTVGVAGDLHIAGGCLSSGYAGSPIQTAESYLPDPFGSEPGGVLYKTGDRARYVPDGTLEFLGRLDTQVKVRGFRIELGEIEAVLTEHPGVAEAVVLAREDTPGDRRLAAYWIPANGAAGGDGPRPEALRRWVAAKLPEYMVPTGWVAREGWPLSPTGKLDRKALPAPHEAAREDEQAAAPAVPPRTGLERSVAAVWREVLGVESVAREANFFDLGGHSLLLARVHERLEAELSRQVAMVELFRNPTVASLAKALGDEEPAEAPERKAPRRRPSGSGAVAVVGLAGRFPGARSVDELWENLRAGVESIRFFSDEELAEAGFDPEELRDPALVKARGVLDDPDLFDAAFFGYSPREAEVIDPQQRLFLETAWQALEDAGQAAAADGRGARVGVFGGASGSDYLRRVEDHPELSKALGAQQIVISNHPDYLPARVSYKLHLTGPSVAVQTACSTSLVAVHLACRSLLEGECDLALAGGASLRGRQVAPYRYVEGGISSPDGHTRAFDARARGVVSGSGVGVVALKRLEDALAEGDAIRAVIRGSAVNNDGGLKAGFTAPSAEGQAEVIREALETAGVDPATVSFVEAHGTATPMGDPIEVEGLKQAFGAGNGERTCALGSIKTNVGHLDAAAGVAGLIKAVLALEHREIPPSLHFEEPNPEIHFEGSPFFVADRLLPWDGSGGPRRAGVSSFGIGGTNAHLVLEEAPGAEAAGAAEEAAAAPGRGGELLVLSAKTEAALDRATEELARHLRERPEVALGDAAWTLQAGRRAFPWRRAVVAPGRDQAPEALEALDRRWSRSGLVRDEPPRVAFLFPGQGAQFPGMGESLYREEPVFRAALDRSAEVLAPELGLDLRELLYSGEERFEEAEARLAATELTQPALFAVEHALAALWESWGVEPAALVGHSLGEYVAATRAGVFELEDSLRLVAARGRLMGARSGGAMLGVRLSEEGLEGYLAADDALALAAVNAPDACVVSGPAESVAALRGRLEADGVGCRPLRTSHAFHSSMMEPVVEPFRELVARLELRPPEVPFVSNVTGTWTTPEEATDPGYWARQLRSPVRFAAGLTAIVGGTEETAGSWALLEVGPGRTLTTLARRHRAAVGARALVPSTRHPRQGGSDTERVLAALGTLWLAGVDVDWAAHHGGREGRCRRRRVPLPTYPFERRSFWVGDGRPRREEPEPAAPSPEPAPSQELSETEAAVAGAFRELLGVEAAGREDDFFELGGSSLMAVQLGARLRELLGVELPTDVLLQASSVGGLAGLAEEGRSAAEAGEAPAASSCLVPLRKTGSRRPLFLVHQVGGHVYSFRSLVQALPADQPVYGLRSPGLEPGEEPLRTVEEMAGHYLELLREVQPRGPYRIGGASMGGMVAFEMAHRLRETGEEPELLTLMDTPCGDQMPPKPEDDAFLVAAVFAGRANLDPEELRPLEPDERLRVGLARARETGRLGEGFDLDQARRLLRVLRANVEALYAYEARSYRGSRIVLFRADELRPGQTHRPELAWVRLARGGIDVTFVPGDHETMHQPPGAEAMAAHLEPHLAPRGASRGGRGR